MTGFLQEVAHRPFPLPAGPWIMRQSWRNLLFAHWPVPAEMLRDLIPAALEIDTFDGYAWVAVVPFSMNDVCPRFVPSLPWISNFLELNVRTYVRKNSIPGVYFFSLDCSNPVAVYAARQFFHLPYYDAQMSLQNLDSDIVYKSERRKTGEKFEAIYCAEGSLMKTSTDSIEHFLTERYCLYTANPAGKLFRGVIHHVPWPLQKANAEIRANTMLPGALRKRCEGAPELLHFSKNIDTVEWYLDPVR
ncbi:MAG: DUF2071 domain-containing protein [Candidatus Obscuribacterales bacterium]|nr:DUF2071 domain-containing protein [Candidatus Obscuribacterales bacterium]